MKLSLTGISLLSILISQTVLAEELPQSSANIASNNNTAPPTEDKKDSSVESDIYDITINGNWQLSSLVNIDNEVFYIPVKFLPSDMLGNLTEQFFVDYKGTRSLKIEKPSITERNMEQLSMAINLPENYFKSQIVKIDKDSTQASTAINALFVNYSLGLDPKALDSTKVTLDANWAGKNGSILRNYFYLDKEKFVRLNTTWKYKLKNNNLLTLGDVFNNTLNGFNSINFAGFRYNTPYYSNLTTFQESMPTLPISGFAVIPTKLDLYINNQIFQTKEINSGKYNIDFPYQPIGYGVAQTYVYDITGKPTIISVPFYGNSEMIKKGTKEYDVSAGFIRKNYGLKSFDYSSPIISGLYKAGITDNYTQDFYTQLSPIYSVVSTLSHWVPHPRIGMIDLGVSLNSEKQMLYRAGFQRATQNLSFGLEYQHGGKEGFCSTIKQNCLISQAQASAGFQLPKKLGSLSMNYIAKKSDKDNNKLSSLQWSKQLNSVASLTASYTDLKSSDIKQNNKTIYAGISFNFGGKYSSNSSLSRDNKGNNFRQSIGISENPDHPEYGYGNISFNKKDNGQSMNIAYGANLSKFSYQAILSKNGDEATGSVNVSGGMTYIPEDNYFSLNKQITNGLTYVNVENATGAIGVFSQNKFSGKTNKKGKFIVPDSLSLSTQSIELDINKLPPDVTLETHKKVFNVPYSGVSKVDFQARSMPYLVKIKGVKAGAIFSINKDYYVVGDDGFTSVESQGKATIPLDDGKTCELEITKKQKEYTCSP